VRIPKNIFHFNNQFLCFKIDLFTAFSHCENTKKPILDVECRTKITPELLFGRCCARRLVSCAECGGRTENKMEQVEFSNRRCKLTARAPRLIYIKYSDSSDVFQCDVMSKIRQCALASCPYFVHTVSICPHSQRCTLCVGLIFSRRVG
jgi:hypothetical protein